MPIHTGIIVFPDTCEFATKLVGVFISDNEINVTVTASNVASCHYIIVVNDSTHCNCPQTEICNQIEEKEANQSNLTFSLCKPLSPSISNLSLNLKQSSLDRFQFQLQLNSMEETGILLIINPDFNALSFYIIYYL